jgi:chromosome segregation ATPase
MKTAITAFLAVLVISSVGIWGCAQQKNDAQARKIRELETRFIKLEEDYRGVVASADTYRKKVVWLETQRVEQSAQLEELKAAAQEKDELKQKLAVRTTERDAVQSQLVQFSRDLQSFASRVEAATAQLAPPGSAPVASPAAAPSKTN